MGDFTIDLVPRVVLQWRVRCVLRRAPIEATSGPDALSLVTAVVATLERGFPPPGLGRAARAWAAGVGDEAIAREALGCLLDVVAQAASDVADALVPVGLDVLFEQLAAAGAKAVTDTREAAVGARRQPDRRLLERHLDQLVADALLTGGDVALGVIEVERNGRAAVHRSRRAVARADEEATGDLAARLRRLVGERHVYRTGGRKLAVVVPGADTVGLGDLVLRTTAACAPRFVWGAASLGAVGTEALASPDSLIVLAEADLHLRRQDLLSARRQLARHRRRFALATAASVLVLVAGVLFGMNGVGGRPAPTRSALPVRPPATQEAPSPPPPPTSTPLPSTGTPPHPTGTPASLAGTLAPSTPPRAGTGSNRLTPSPANGGGTPGRRTTGTSSSPSPAGSDSAPAGGSGPSSVTAVLDQFLSTAVGAVVGVASLLGVHVASAAPRAHTAGTAGLLLGG